MREQDVPQDWGPEAEIRRLMYAVGEDGRFVGVQSVGWDVSNTGFNKYWEHVGQIIAAARADVAQGRKAAETVRRCMTELRDIAPAGGAYVSESNFFEPDFQHTYWGRNYARLAELKKRYDPGGLFTVHNGVASEEWSADGFSRR